MRRLFAALAVSTGLCVAAAAPAVACGGLVAPNGAVQLARTTTLAAWHAGVEHYVTSFTYAGVPGDFGSIIPLPGVPTDVRRAGSWTLQRLERETHPSRAELASAGAGGAEQRAAQVLLHTTVDALDITVLSGGGDAVLSWIRDHGYAVSEDAPAMINFYARRSPVFLAARFNGAEAAARGQRAGDGTPVQITIPTPNPWVPLHILSLAKGTTAAVDADVYLLSDRQPALAHLDPGVGVEASQPASTNLLDDLRSDKDSEWVPQQAWLTFIHVDTTAGRLVHDLSVDASGAGLPSPSQAGYDPLGPLPAPRLVGFKPVPPVAPSHRSRALLLTAGLVLVACAVGASTVLVAARRARVRAESGSG